VNPIASSRRIHVLCAFLLAGSSWVAGSNDWPVYRHDAALTGVSPGQGRIHKPEIKWEYYLGPPPVTLATVRKPENPNAADLDGDGTLEPIWLSGKTSKVEDRGFNLLWTETVDGQPLGGNVCVCRLLPDRKGLQILSFSHRMDTGAGQGYCFAFDQGAKNGELVWT